MKFKYLVIIAIFISSSSFSTELYKWTDEKGKIHYSDNAQNTSGNVTKSVLKDQLYPRSETSIRRELQPQIGRVFAKYNRALRENPKPQGKFIVKIAISPAGKVVKSTIVKSELLDTHLENELLESFSSMQFSEGDVATTDFVYSVDFLSMN